MRDFDCFRILEYALPQECHNRRDAGVLTDAMSERDVSACACLHGKRHAGDVCLMCIQRRFAVTAIFLRGRSLEVKGNNTRAADIFFNFRHVADRLIIIHSLHLKSCSRELRE